MTPPKGTFTRATYVESVARLAPTGSRVTAHAEQAARETGRLHPLVDPAGHGAIRRSLNRFVELPNKLFQLTNGTALCFERRVDTTGSMETYIDIVTRSLADDFEMIDQNIPGYDPQFSTGSFGDKGDRFILCRPQFEMEAEKIVKQLTLCVPEGKGGDEEEDPHYGLFGAAYLTAAYINRIGLKGYDFTISDAPARDELESKQLIRVFGEEVFEKVQENGHQIDKHNLPNTAEVVQALLTRAHAFFLQVGRSDYATRFWTNVFGRNRVVILPRAEFLPHVQAVIVGLTEGTLSLETVREFLNKNNVEKRDAEDILRSVANIQIGAQAALPNFNRRPKVGDIFRNKTDLWPMTAKELAEYGVDSKTPEGEKEPDEWL